MPQIIMGILLLILSAADIKHHKIPGYMILLTGLVGGISNLISRQVSAVDMLLGAMVGIIMLCLSIISQGAVGIGDGLLVCATGVYLGFKDNAVLFLLALMLASVLSGILLVLKKSPKTELPFVPFIFVAYLVFRFLINCAL